MLTRNTTLTRATLRTRGPAAVAAVALLLAACGSADAEADDPTGLGDPDGTAEAGDDSSAAGETSFEDAMLAFAQCMRDQGIDFPDPQIDNGRVIIPGGPGLDASSPEVERARGACEHLTEGAGPAGAAAQLDPEEQARVQEQALAFAQCMRDEGIDFPDPDLSEGGGGQIGGGPGGSGPNIDASSPAFQSALETCQEHVGDGFQIRTPGQN